MPRAVADDGEAIRAFFAVELDDVARRAAADVARTLRGKADDGGVRWVRPEAYHVTLRFLGEIEADRIPGLVDRVRGRIASQSGFRLELGDVCAFPSPRRPRVVALQLTPAEPLAQLALAVERGVVEAGFPSEPRPFRPHLTLGRVPRGRGSVDVTALVTAAREAFSVTDAVLFRSQLRRGGAHYTPLERFPLGEGSNHP